MITPIVADFAHFNPVQWDALVLGPIKGVILKAYQFAPDDKYAGRILEARKRGLLCGSYCFATDHPPAQTAPAYLAAAQPLAGELCALDFERNFVNGVQHNMTGPAADEWCDRVEQKTQRWCWVYGGDLARERITPACHADSAMADRFVKRRLWHCRYVWNGRDVTLDALAAFIKPGIPGPWKDWDLLQYAADGNGPLPQRVPGLQPKADLNAFRGNRDALAAIWAGDPLPVAA